MRLEESGEHIIFRNATIARAMAQKYHDGVIVKLPEELERADQWHKETYGMMPLFDGHTKDRLVGFALPPAANQPSFINGKIKRDIFFEKEVLTPEEMDDLRKAAYSRKKDLSIGFDDETEYKDGIWNGQPINGFSHNIKMDHLSWEVLGRCSSNDGCGLVRSDTIRHDGILLTDEGTDPCVSKKIRIFMSEHPEWAKDKVVAAAINYCRQREKQQLKKDSGDVTPDTRTDKEKVFLQEAQNEIIETFEEQEQAEAKKTKTDVSNLILERLNSFDSALSHISSVLESLKPLKTDQADIKAQTEPEVRTDTTPCQDTQKFEEVSKRLDALEKDVKTRLDEMKNLRLSKNFGSWSISDIKRKEQEQKEGTK